MPGFNLISFLPCLGTVSRKLNFFLGSSVKEKTYLCLTFRKELPEPRNPSVRVSFRTHFVSSARRFYSYCLFTIFERPKCLLGLPEMKMKPKPEVPQVILSGFEKNKQAISTFYNDLHRYGGRN